MLLSFDTRPPSLRFSPWLPGLMGVALLCGLVGQSTARAGGLEQVVRSFCLTAFEQEMHRAGKGPPAGMADYACSCVADRIVDGTSLDDAQQTCRLATVRRYPL